MISHVVEANAMYPASAKDRDTIICFLVFQEIRVSPIKMQNPEVDFLVSRHDAQSESTKDLS